MKLYLTIAAVKPNDLSKTLKHIHTRFLFIQDVVFRKPLTMSAIKTDVNPSDIGTKALGRERFYRLRSMLGMGTELIETSSPGKWYSGDEWWIRRVERSTHVSKRRFLKKILSATRDASRI